MDADQHFLFCYFFPCCGLWCGGGCGCVGRSASVGGWVHRWVARLWAPINTFFFFFSCCGLWCGGGYGCVGRSASVGGWVHRWVAGLWAPIDTFCFFFFLLWAMVWWWLGLCG